MWRKLEAVLLSVACAATAAAGVVQSNEQFTVTWDERDGTLASLVLNGDRDRMNWIAGTDRWGTLRRHVMEIDWTRRRDTWGDTAKFGFAGMHADGADVVSVYTNAPLRAEVRRRVTARPTSTTAGGTTTRAASAS